MISGRSEEMSMMAIPSAARRAQEPVDVALGAHVHAAGGLVDDEETRAGCRTRCSSSTFCWLPPERLFTTWPGPWATILKSRILPSANSSMRPAAQEAEQGAGEVGQVVGHHVVADREIEVQAVGLPVLGEVADARADGLPRGLASRRFCPRRNSSPASAGSAPKMARPSSVRPEPDQARRSRRSRRRVHLEAHVGELALAGEPRGLEDRLADAASRPAARRTCCRSCGPPCW